MVMESTGVYWIPLFGVLEERGFQVKLVVPRRIKNVPGRKTDVLDCQWLQQLHTYGLLSVAFRPDGEIRRLRSYLWQRAMLVKYASHHVQHMQKALTQMNLKLHHVISDITGKTGMDIIEDIVRGERSSRRLAQLRDPRIKAHEKTIAKSLQGHWREEHIFELAQALELSCSIKTRSPSATGRLKPNWSVSRITAMAILQRRSPAGDAAKGNAPRFEVWTHLYRMTGVDLTRIDGVGAYTALKVISKIGTDMTKWPSARHFASWLGLSPNNRITGGKVISSTTKPSASRAAAALRLAANALHRSEQPPWAPFCAERKRSCLRPRPSPPPPTNWPGSSTPCCVTVRSTWTPERSTTGSSIRTGRCTRPIAGRRNWAISWCLSPNAPSFGTAPRIRGRGNVTVSVSP